MPPPGYKGKRPSRPKRSRPKRSGPRRGAGGRRANLRKSARRSAEARQDRARSGQNKKKADIRKDGASTPREKGIAAANKYTPKKKQTSLEQSVGSLDRRINTALQKGDTALAKDLRSRKKGFVKKLGYEKARKVPGGVVKDSSGKIMKTSDGSPMLTSAGFDVFQETMDMDFLDPTRQIQNEYPEAYADMYPISNQLQKGLPGVRFAKEALGLDKKKIPYTDPDMPGVRYPLDTTFGAFERDPITTRSDRQAPLDEGPSFPTFPRQPGLDFIPEVKTVTDKDRQAAIDRGIDPNFIFSLPDDPRTELIESDLNTGSALQLAEAANVQDTLSDLVRPEFTSSNVFALPEQVKENLNKDAKENVKTYEIETYGKEITSDDLAKAGVNEAYYNMNFDTPIIQKQLFESGVIKEKDVQAPIVKDVEAAQSGNLAGQIAGVPLDLIGFMGGNLVPGYENMTDYVRNRAFVPQKTYTGTEYLDKLAADKQTAINNVNRLNIDDIKKTELTNFINNPPDMTTGLLDQNNLSLSDMVVNENFDTGVNTDQGSLDVLNSLAEKPNYLKRLFGFNQ